MCLKRLWLVAVLPFQKVVVGCGNSDTLQNISKKFSTARKYKKMPHAVSEQDVLAIKEWLEKEAHLPKDIDDLLIRKFLHSCYSSLEKTKQCINKFCTTRVSLSEIYTSRDPLAPKMETALTITSVCSYNAGDDELLVHQLDDPNLEKFSFYDVLKSFTIQADYWLRSPDMKLYPEGHIVVLDIKDYTLKILTKVNVMYFRDFLIFLLESMPVRLKQIHVVNCPSYYEKMYVLVKPVLPTEICNIITFHPDAASLRNSVDKKYLPSDYGGDNDSLKEQQNEWIRKLAEFRKMFLNDNLWKADTVKKSKNGDETLNGSFRTLSID